VRLGYLEPGDQLPRVKDVVGSLAINPTTVLKAYRELEHRGLAAGRGLAGAPPHCLTHPSSRRPRPGHAIVAACANT
jgi:DNA-binding transcriptional MocR family regulator